VLFKLLINVQIKRFEVGGIYNALSVKKNSHKLGRKILQEETIWETSLDRMEILYYNLETEQKA
jgi:hypothetical protein